MLHNEYLLFYSVHVSSYSTFWTNEKELFYLLNLRCFEQMILPD